MKEVLLLVMVLAPLTTRATDLSGTWQIDSVAGKTPIIVDCTLYQSGNALSGNCAPRSESATPAEFTGSVAGSKVQWGYKVQFRGNPGTVAFEGMAKSDASMSGTLKLNGNPNPFTARKLGRDALLQRLLDESDIRAMLQEYMAVLTARDWDKYITYFSKEGELDMPEGIVHGREPIRARMVNATERMAMAAAAANRPTRRRAELLNVISVRVAGDFASAKSRFTFITENEAGQFMVSGSGLYIDTWVREEGRWLIKRRKIDYDLLVGQDPAQNPPAPPGVTK
jgi:3-phenylpropionate/cinnamic acid dioxygenase small subunit